MVQRIGPKGGPDEKEMATQKVYHMNCVLFLLHWWSCLSFILKTGKDRNVFPSLQRTTYNITTFQVTNSRQMVTNPNRQRVQRKIAMTSKSFILSLASEQRNDISIYACLSLFLSFFFPQVYFLGRIFRYTFWLP